MRVVKREQQIANESEVLVLTLNHKIASLAPSPLSRRAAFTHLRGRRSPDLRNGRGAVYKAHTEAVNSKQIFP